MFLYKSSLSILNLINKTEGKVFFKGENLEKNRVDLKCLIGYLPSEINLYELFKSIDPEIDSKYLGQAAIRNGFYYNDYPYIQPYLVIYLQNHDEML